MLLGIYRHRTAFRDVYVAQGTGILVQLNIHWHTLDRLGVGCVYSDVSSSCSSMSSTSSVRWLVWSTTQDVDTELKDLSMESFVGHFTRKGSRLASYTWRLLWRRQYVL